MRWGMMVLAVVAATSGAAERDIGVAADARWQHAETGVVLPPQLGGMPRTALTDATHTGRDVTARFDAPDHSMSVAMYVFHPALADVGLWFDAAEASLEASPTFRNATRATIAPVAFDAGTGRARSSLRQVYRLPDAPHRSIAMAVVPVGEWLVSINLRATMLTSGQLQARLHEIVEAVGWPGPTGPASPVARPVLACTTPLTFAARPEADLSARGPWCREGEARRDYGVYRADNDAAAYVMLVNDSGGVVHVQAAPRAPDAQEPTYAVTLLDVDGNVATFPSFSALPLPSQVWARVMAASAPAP